MQREIDDTFVKVEQGLIKKRLDFKMDKVSVLYDTSQALFSSVGIDRGTQALLNSLRKNKAINFNKILDLGCGYGALGLFLKKRYPDSVVTLSDRDALAALFCQHNAKLNNMDVRVTAALDYPEFEGCYTLILTNFPAKLERQGIKSFLIGASKRLISGGVFAIVVVTELTEDFKTVLQEFDGKVNAQYQEQKNGYTIYHITFNEELKGEIDHKRSSLELENGFVVETVRGLPEYDSLSFGTLAVLELIKELPQQKSIFIYGASQGHLAVLAAEYLRPSEITIASRDLLSLRVSSDNLSKAGINHKVKVLPYLDQMPSDELVLLHVVGKNDSYLSELNIKALNRENVLMYGEKLIVERFIRSFKLVIKKKVEEKGYIAILT